MLLMVGMQMQGIPEVEVAGTCPSHIKPPVSI